MKRFHHTVLFQLLFRVVFSLVCLSPHLFFLISPYRWADKRLVWSGLICQGLQWCYLFMNSQRMNPPGHVSSECAGGNVTLSPTSKSPEPLQNLQQNPYRTSKVGREAAPGSVVSEITPAADLCCRCHIHCFCWIIKELTFIWSFLRDVQTKVWTR